MNKAGLKLSRMYDKLMVKVYETRDEMGKAAADEGATKICESIAKKGSARVVFAAAPSALEFFKELTKISKIDWSKVTVFHMDEYLGLRRDDPQSFGSYLKKHLFDQVHPGTVHFIDGKNASEKESARYTDLLNEAPLDICFMGIGENGHIAFNDPPVADFDDPFTVKEVELDQACRMQQVNDGCFPSLDKVPKKALTMTIPALLKAKQVYCIVPGPRKRDAVYNCLYGPIKTSCPASILRTKKGAVLFLDSDAFGSN